MDKRIDAYRSSDKATNGFLDALAVHIAWLAGLLAISTERIVNILLLVQAGSFVEWVIQDTSCQLSKIELLS